MVLALALVTMFTGEPWLLLFLVYGFVARVLTGPTLSPIGLIATRFVVPLLNIPEKPVPGPPKRFAQFVGLIVSTTGAVLFIWVSPVAGKHAPLLRPLGFAPGLCLPRRTLPDSFGHQFRGVELHGLETAGRQVSKDPVIRHEGL